MMYKEQNIFDPKGAKPVLLGSGVFRMIVLGGFMINDSIDLWRNCKFLEKLGEALGDPELGKARTDGIDIVNIYVIVAPQSITNNMIASLAHCKYTITYVANVDKVSFGTVPGRIYDMFKYDIMQGYIVCCLNEQQCSTGYQD